VKGAQRVNGVSPKEESGGLPLVSGRQKKRRKRTRHQCFPTNGGTAQVLAILDWEKANVDGRSQFPKSSGGRPTSRSFKKQGEGLSRIGAKKNRPAVCHVRMAYCYLLYVWGRRSIAGGEGDGGMAKGGHQKFSSLSQTRYFGKGDRRSPLSRRGAVLVGATCASKQGNADVESKRSTIIGEREKKCSRPCQGPLQKYKKEKRWGMGGGGHNWVEIRRLFEDTRGNEEKKGKWLA